MKNLENYAMKILVDNGCDFYTYGNDGMEKHILSDLKEAYPNGMDFPYIDVANAILAMSKPRPISKMPFMVLWETDSCSDGHGAESFEEAHDSAIEILCNWMVEARMENASDEEWNYMIYNCSVSVYEYNKDTDEYEEVWSPSYDDEKEIGWDEREER